MSDKEPAIPLRRFQEETVDEIMDRLDPKRGVRLALADEVGLGKTHVIAEVGSRLCEEGTAKTVIYVAPSREVSAQNGPKIAEACGLDPKKAKLGVSRLTLLPAQVQKNVGPSVFSITPWTSFDLTGPGNREERAFLFQVLRQIGKGLKARGESLPGTITVGTKMGLYSFRWVTVLFRPKYETLWHYRDLPNYKAWETQVAKSRAAAKAVASALLKDREWIANYRSKTEALEKRKLKDEQAALKETCQLVSMLRYEVAKKVFIKSHKPDVIFFDEWHKYQTLLRREVTTGQPSILELALKEWQDDPAGAPTLALFVSATPFEVSLEQVKEGNRVSGLTQLCRVLDPSDDTEERVEAQRKHFQSSWEAYRDALISGNAKKEKESRKACMERAKDFSEFLSTFIIRRERPRAQDGTGCLDDQVIAGDWENARLHTLKRLAETDSGSDVVGLWSSSSHFPLMHESYSLALALKNHRKKANGLCQEDHWKRTNLASLIAERWGQDKGRLIPPLWNPPLTPNRAAHPGKVLIFSSWRAVPLEIAYFFQDRGEHSPWTLDTSRTKSPLGAFPVSMRQKSDQSKIKKFGWRILYPFLAFDARDRKFWTWLKAALGKDRSSPERSANPSANVPKRDWRRVLTAVDLAYVDWVNTQGNKLRAEVLRAAALQRIVHLKVDVPESWLEVFADLTAKQALQVYKDLTLGGNPSHLPGAELMAQLAATCTEAKALAPEAQKDLLLACHAATNYFNREMAQRVIRTVAGKLDYVEAVPVYCRKHQWRAMLHEYLSLLWIDHCKKKAHLGTTALLHDLVEAMSVRAAPVGRWKERRVGSASVVQPFIEAKEASLKDKDKHGAATKAESDDEISHGSEPTTRRRKAFNSPFLPMVLVSTSIGQEGVDFHRYCDTVIHWNPPESPLTLEQREGRVDRFLGYQIRKLRDGKGPAPMIPPDPLELSPDFCLQGVDGRKVNQTQRLVYALPFSREYRTWQRCLERLHYFRLFIGSSDAAALEAELQEKLAPLKEDKRVEVLKKLAEISVSLAPTREKKKGRKGQGGPSVA